MRATATPLSTSRSRTTEILIIASFIFAGCSSDPSVDRHTGESDANQSAHYKGTFNVTLWGFLDLPVPNSGAPTQKPKYVYVAGQVYDGPYPETLVDTALPLPADATPGCAVYRSGPPDCDAIGGCGTQSSNAVCAANAKTNPCVCTADSTCQVYPNALDAGQVTMTGIADTTGATSFTLANLSNYYQLPNGVSLAYPGFAEGAALALSAAGGGQVPPFQLSNNGVAPLAMTTPGGGYALTKSSTGSDPTQYDPLNLQWTPPADSSNTTFEVEIDISRHAGTVGYLACNVEDSGSLTISAGLITQLVQLGNVGGFAELAVARVTSTSAELADDRGEVEFEVSSADEYVISVQGYTSCVQDSDCSNGQSCDRSIKLCGATNEAP